MSDPTPDYSQKFQSALFEMPPGASTGWSAYLLPKNVAEKMDPISIADSFSKFSGHYLFAPSAPELPDETVTQQFIDAVRRQILSCFGSSFGDRVCMWLLDADGPVFGTPCSGYAFSFGPAISGYTLGSNFNNPMGTQLSFSIGSGAPISGMATGLKVGSSSSSLVNFVTLPDSSMGPTVSPSIANIPVIGPYSGCFLMQGRIDTSVTLAYFNAGFRYAHGDSGGGSDVAQTYPMLVTSKPGTVFSYIGSVDPLDPVNRNAATVDAAAGQLRTLLMPVPSGAAPPQFASWFRTSQNRSLALVPVSAGDAASGPAPNAASFVFQFAGPVPAPGTRGRLYITTAGDYGLAVSQGSSSDAFILCGLFGSESMSFRPYDPNNTFDRIRFIPGNGAYAPIFPFPTATLDDPSGGSVGDRLTTIYTTSWAMMINGDGGDVRYFAQPEGSPLFAVGPTGAAEDGTVVLDAFNTGTKLEDTPGFAVPMVPYAGIATVAAAFTGDDLVTYESQIISPTRKALIAKSVESAMMELKNNRRMGLLADAVSTKTTTPQGLLAEVTEGSIGADYTKVTLAQSVPTPGRPPEMAFIDLEVPLQNLLQSNQLFAVVVNPKFLGAMISVEPDQPITGPAFENTVTITDWTMAANVGEGVMATDYRNVMIFKFGEGTVRDRVLNPNKWVGVDQFSIAENGGDPSVALTGLSQWLQNFIDGAIVEATVKNNALYRNFANIVQDPNWNGILVLRADVLHLPDDLGGLAAGIDFSRFEAHHFGVTVSRVAVNGTDITIDGPSSMFGLIDYQLPLFQQSVATGGNPNVPLGVPVDGPYGFTVLQLQALFTNSTMVDFQSRVQLTTNTLFDSRVLQTYTIFGVGASNAVVLKGSYQTQGATSTYVFEQNSRTIFIIDSNAFNAIAFTRVQFNTLTTDDEQIVSRFLIWGVFDFKQLTDGSGEPFDVLSFGSPGGTPAAGLGTGLAFSNLQIQLASPADTPNAVTFTFDAGGLAFDLANSTAREKSLFPTFALQLDSFIASTADKRPSDYGYLPVRSAVPIREISGPWYGVAYKITMGTPGALVSGAGFESRMLLAWSPQTLAADTTIALFTGLQLPGAAPGAKLLSLQGVLKVSIDSIQLLYQAVTGGAGEKSFNLRLGNMGLKFLGIVKLPPGATINFFLFGRLAGTGSLGWYAAYNQNKPAMPMLESAPASSAPAMLPETAANVPAVVPRQRTPK